MTTQNIFIGLFCAVLFSSCKKDDPVDPNQPEDKSIISDSLVSGGSQTSFQRIIGGELLDAFYSVAQDADGNYYLTGFTENDSADYRDVLLMKCNSVGEIIWHKRYSENFIDQGWDHSITSDNAIIMATTSSTGSNVGMTSPYYGQLIKTDMSGNEIWSYQFSFGDYTSVNTVVETTDGGYVVCGTEYQGPYGFILKTDNQGTELWRKSFDTNTGFYDLKETADGGFIICGTHKTSTSADLNTYVVKTNSTGDSTWTKIYGNNMDNRSNAVIETSSNGFSVCGSNANPGNSNFIMLLDTNGDSTWYNEFNSINLKSFDDLIESSDNKLIAIGRESFGTTSSTSIVKMDMLGNFIWNNEFTPSSYNAVWDIEQTSDNGFVMAGYSNGSGLIIKTDAQGN